MPTVPPILVGALVLLLNLPCFFNPTSQVSFTLPMPALLEASKPLSILISGLSLSSTPWAAIVVLSVVVGAAETIHYASPQRLTGVLVVAMADVKKKISRGRREWGPLEVSTIRQASLLSSLSHYAMLCDVLKGRTFTILCCIHEVHKLGTHIEILKESHLREIVSRRFATQTAPSTTSVVGF
ncbi:hypothetical protein DFH08DRAFT_828060 [Mycena albidolilacea]|uniref:Uncharacterized protein n=1 Tax=Mycena albidolilacea TaxID=1033008 RepID=A0AAD6YXL9_9AGAR|nr:hypothetical protein DFH08DRAFT_828060 [Mycena albidolilacea]